MRYHGATHPVLKLYMTHLHCKSSMRDVVVVVVVSNVCPPQHMMHPSDPFVEVLVIVVHISPALAASRQCIPVVLPEDGEVWRYGGHVVQFPDSAYVWFSTIKNLFLGMNPVQLSGPTFGTRTPGQPCET